MLECVVNVSEGRDRHTINALAAAVGDCLLDVHSDPHHHRSVLTLAGDDVEAAVRNLTTEAVARIDIRAHVGVHPRIGVVDVVPFVPLAAEDAAAARNRFAEWAAQELAIPCFLYGTERTLPDVRRQAFRELLPDTGPPRPHPTAGAIAVGARPVLVAYNLWLAPGTPVEEARRIAAALRGPAVRALGLDVGGQAQVSMNLVSPLTFGPAHAYDAVTALAPVDRAELVGLVPAAVLESTPTERWSLLDLDPGRTIEARVGGRTVRPRRSPDAGPGPAGGGGAAAPAR